MTNSKLIQFLKTIDATELKVLGDFLKIAKGANDVNKLFNYLRRYHPEFDKKKVDKELLANKVFSNTIESKKKLENTMVKFIKLLDDFFIQQELKRDTIDEDFLYLKALRRRKLDSYFFRKVDQMKKQWDKSSPVGLEHFHDEYKLNKMYYMHPNFNLSKASPKGLVEILIRSIDKYYFSEKLFRSLLLIHNGNFFKNKNDNTQSERLLNEIVKLTNRKDFKDIPQINLLNLLLKSFLSANFNNMQPLKEMFVDQMHLYDETERRNIFTLLETGHYENFKTDKKGAIKNLFDLNCLMIDQNCVLQEGYIPYDRFSNIINIGLAAKQLDWTENFVKEYGQHLPEEIKEDALKISNASIRFHKSAFRDALFLLVDVKYKNELFGLYGRSIQLQCGYELNDDDLYFGLANAFSLHLNRNDKFAQNITAQFLNFINFSKRLFRLRLNFNTTEYSKLKEELTQNTNIAYKTWLTKKLIELNMKNK